MMLEYYKASKIHSLGLDTQPTLKNVRYYFMPRKLKKNVCALEKCIPYVPEMRPGLPWLLSLRGHTEMIQGLGLEQAAHVCVYGKPSTACLKFR